MPVTSEMTVYRAGSPESGEGFWTPDSDYAREVHPEGALHTAMLLPGFSLKDFNEPRSDRVVWPERDAKAFDVLSFPGPATEFVVLNPAALKILQ